MLPLSTVLTRSMSRQMSNTAINENFGFQHHLDRDLFEMQIDSNYNGIVEYRKEDNVYNLFHSEIPAHLRGKGYGNILAKKTFDYIAAKNYQMSISCPFLLKCYKENENKYRYYYVD